MKGTLNYSYYSETLDFEDLFVNENPKEDLKDNILCNVDRVTNCSSSEEEFDFDDLDFEESENNPET